MRFFADKYEKKNYLENWKIVRIIFVIWLIIHTASIFVKKETSINSSDSSPANTITSITQKTKVEESRYNNLAPSEYYKEMKSENLEYADIAWQASKTYGWNCSEVTNLGDKVYTNGNEIQDSLLREQMVGYYQVATCSSGVKLRVYPRKDTYPIITNINGGWE